MKKNIMYYYKNYVLCITVIRRQMTGPSLNTDDRTCNKIPILFFRLSCSTYKKPRYQQKQSPRRGAHDRTVDGEGDGRRNPFRTSPGSSASGMYVATNQVNLHTVVGRVQAITNSSITSFPLPAQPS